MNDITLAEMIAAIEDETLKAWWEKIGNLPEEFTMCEFFMKSLPRVQLRLHSRMKAKKWGKRFLVIRQQLMGL